MATIQDYQKQLAELYLAFFDRAPDASGMAFWVGHLVSGALTLEAIAKDWWETQAETKAKYPAGLSTSEFVERIYQNVLGRDSDKDGKAFWVKDLDAGKISRDTFIQEIIKGAKAETGGETDRAYLANRTEVSLELLRHDDVIDRDSMAKILKSVDSSKESLQTAKDKVETMSATHNHSSDENVLIVLAENLIANPDSYADGSIGLLAGVEKNQLSNINNASDKLAPNAIKSIPEAAKNDGGLENLIKAGKVADGAVAKLTGVTNANLEKVVEIMSKLKDGAVQEIKDLEVGDLVQNQQGQKKNINSIITLGDKVKDGAVMMKADQITDDNIEAIVSIAKKLKGEVMFNDEANVAIDKLEGLKMIATQIEDGKITLTGEINNQNINAVAEIASKLKADSIATHNDITIDVSNVASIKALAAAVTNNKVILTGEINKDNVAKVAEVAAELQNGSIQSISELSEGTDFTKVKAINSALDVNAIKKIVSIDASFGGVSRAVINDDAIEKVTGVTNADINTVVNYRDKLKDGAVEGISVTADKADRLSYLGDKIKAGTVTITDEINNANQSNIQAAIKAIKDNGGITSIKLTQTEWSNIPETLKGKLGADSKAEFSDVTGAFEATVAKDIIILKADAEDVVITNFGENDSISFQDFDNALTKANSEEIDTLKTNADKIEKKIYVLSSKIAEGISDAATLYNKLFANNGKHFTDSVDADTKAIIVAGKQIYSINSMLNGNNDVAVGDIKLLGTVDSEFGVGNIAG